MRSDAQPARAGRFTTLAIKGTHMKFVSTLVQGALLSAIAVGNASAACSLSVSQDYVPFGQNFSFTVNLSPQLFPGPFPPPEQRPGPPFTFVFFGTKNGVDDIPSGYQHPGGYQYGTATLSGYGNPASGGLNGTYSRKVVVYDRLGNAYCTTNTVAIVLQ
jgi:hypothetical protein